jgi:hypothetical protein
MRSSSVVVLLGLADVLLVGCHGGGATDPGAISGSPDASAASLDGTWERVPGFEGKGLHTLSIQTLDDAGLRIEAILWKFSSAEGTLHGKPVVGDTLDVLVGVATERVPYPGLGQDAGFLDVVWQDTDQLDFFRTSDGIVHAAFWSGPSKGLHGYTGRLARVDDASGPRLQLPPDLAVDLGLAADETLVQKYPWPGDGTDWPDAMMNSGASYQTANWPTPLVRLADGGLPFTEWPASRLDLYRDGNYRYFQLVEGRAVSVRGVLARTPELRWDFSVQDVALPLVLDDGSSVPTEPSGFAGGVQRAYQAPDLDAGLGGMIITGLDSAPLQWKDRLIADAGASVTPVTRR